MLFFRLLLKILCCWVSFAICSSNSFANEKISDPIRVQLAWYHQSQFTGFYIAEVRKHFESQGLNVTLIEGGSTINPILEIQEGRADVAVSWLGYAWIQANKNKPVTNIAQIFTGSALTVACRISAGVFTSKDMVGKKIGVWELGDEIIVKEMLRELEIPTSTVQLVKQAPNGKDLIDGNVACATVMTYNEYWAILSSGVPSSDLVLIGPDLFGIPHVEDGLYVSTERLASPVFREQMVRLIRGLRTGWSEARIAPSLAIEVVHRVAPNLDKQHQQHMLEAILELIPKNSAEFGIFELRKYRIEVNRLLAKAGEGFVPQSIWTHEIINQLKKEDGNTTPLTYATTFYATSITTTLAFKILVYLGVFIYALSGALEAINRNYDLWGRLTLAFLSGVGGGTLVALIIGGDRLPFYYVKDPIYPLGILVVVLISTFVVMIYPNAPQSENFKKTKKYADVLGFSMLAVTGAMASITSGLPWFWAPICATLQCAGGGVLRDIVMNQEPKTFKGVIYEEVAIVGAFFLVFGLMISNHFENTPIPVFLSLIFSVLLIIGLRLAIYKYEWQYPKFLGGNGQAH